jgi:hypothetical protein
MTSKLPSARAAAERTSPGPTKQDLRPPCKHPRVQIVSRDEESEYVECLECREVFESSEFKDMSIEEERSGDEA